MRRALQPLQLAVQVTRSTFSVSVLRGRHLGLGKERSVWKHNDSLHALAPRLLVFLNMETDANRLRYLSADCVDIPAAGKLTDTLMVGEDDQPLGTIDGIVIDPMDRQVRFYVIKSGGWLRSHRYLMSATAVRIENEGHVLHVVGSSDREQLREVDNDAFPRYSIDDLADVLATPRVA
jgi:hypothetical protein